MSDNEKALRAIRKAKQKFLKDMKNAKQLEHSDRFVYVKTAANALRSLFGR